MTRLDPGVPTLGERELEGRIASGHPVVVFFYANWCGFCHAFSDAFADAVTEAEVEAVGADISERSDPRWKRYDVAIVPTLVAFRGGEQVARADGRPGLGLGREDADRLVEQIAG